MNYFKCNWLRRTFQVGILAAIVLFFFKAFGNESFDPEAYCPFGGLQTLATYLTRGSMACSMTMVQIMMGVVLAAGVILFGKLFCSYLCPLGLVNESFVRLRRVLKLKALTIKNGSVTDKILRAVKYILLFTIFYMTLSSSELFCKNFDPYYAFATGFKGELTVWMACISIGVLFLGSLLVDMFWCKYVCPLGALSNLFKFTLAFAGLVLIYWILIILGLNISWIWLLSVAVVVGYLLEICVRSPKYNISFVHICKDSEKCNGCKLCIKKCPYHIDLHSVNKVTDVDCNLCGECVAACSTGALSVTKCSKSGKFIPPILTVLLFAIALYLGNTMELPTIDMRWLPEQMTESQLKSIELEGLRSVKCYGSSMAFKAQVSKVPGVYGVKTFVKHGKVVVYYNPEQTTPEKIQEGIFTPSKFRIMTPDSTVTKVKVITLRTENMHDKMDINYLGLQFRALGKQYYGIESEYACPIIVRLYMGVDEPVDEDLLEKTIEMKVLDMPQHGGGSKQVPCNFKFVELEEDNMDTLEIRPYLEKMFPAFKASFTKKKGYEGKELAVYEIEDEGFEKPIFTRNMSYISNHMSQQRGVAEVKLELNEKNKPALKIVFVPELIDASGLWSALTMETWKIFYKEGDVRDTPAKWKFTTPGVVK